LTTESGIMVELEHHSIYPSDFTQREMEKLHNLFL
jgi:hypothetical protein